MAACTEAGKDARNEETKKARLPVAGSSRVSEISTRVLPLVLGRIDRLLGTVLLPTFDARWLIALSNSMTLYGRRSKVNCIPLYHAIAI